MTNARSANPRTFTALFPFCGLGAGALGFLNARVTLGGEELRFKSLGGIDNDAASCEDFEYLTKSSALHADVKRLTPAELRAFAGEVPPDVIFSSPPCLPSHEEVVTPTGPRRIEEMRAGDLVLTHLGRFRRVLRVGTHVYQGAIFGVRLNGTVDTREFTAEHPIWRRRVVRSQTTGRPRVLADPEFVRADQLRVGDRVGFPIVPESLGAAKAFVGAFGDPRIVEREGRPVHHPRVVDLRPHAMASELWFLLGAYVGDGYRVASKHETNFCVGAEGGPLDARVRFCLSILGLKYSIDRSGGPTNIKVRVASRHLSLLAGAFGDGAAEKTLPESIMGLEDRLVDALLDGYRSTDGSEQPIRPQGRQMLQARWRIPSVSLPLLRGFQRLLLRSRIYASIHVAWPGGPQTIMGRVVQTLPRWELCAALDPKKRTIHEFDGDHVWIRVRDIHVREAAEPVWNLEVEEDNTFCAPLIATHNCKGFSGLLSAKASKQPKYQDLNRLVLDWVELMLSTWDVPPRLFLLENVPRIASRGKPLLAKVKKLLRDAGYLLTAQTHDCGVLGGLAQHRQRFLLVARHAERCPPLLYQPPPQPVRACGEVLGALPLPEDPVAGPMHRLPRLSWLNWVRLSLIPAGGDWRDLEGTLRDGQPRREVHRRHCVERWKEPSATIAGSGSNAVANVADPRLALDCGPNAHWNKYAVRAWDRPAPTVIGAVQVGSGAPSVADPRFGNVERVTSWSAPVGTITSSPAPSSGAAAVADPRVSIVPRAAAYDHGYGVLRADEPSSTIAGGSDVGQGAYSFADVRFSGEYYRGTYGVIGWEEAAGTITGNANVGCGRFAVADPRKAPPELRIIIAADGTWHRPLTTLELAALQGMPTRVDNAPLKLAGDASGKWRERIGNAVPPPAARAIAEQMLVCLAQGAAGLWSLSGSGSVWVERAVEQGAEAGAPA